MIELEKTVDLLPAEIKFFDFIKGSDFPWFYQASTYNFHMTCHTFMRRNENAPNDRGIANSQFLPVAESIFLRICKDNGVKVKTLYRLAVNATEASAHARGDLHVDQGSHKHRVFLLYLNEFSDGSTYVYLNDDYEPYEVKAAPFKAVVFDGELHAQGFCRVGERRLVFVATFNPRDE